jgi:hypothetical protein
MDVVSFLPSSTTDFGQSELDTPDLTLVAQTVFTDDLQLGVARFREGRMLDTRDISDISRENKLMLSGQDTRTDEPIRMLFDNEVLLVLEYQIARKCRAKTHVDEGPCRSWNMIVAP